MRAALPCAQGASPPRRGLGVSARTGLVQTSRFTILLPLHREMPPSHHEAWLCDDTFQPPLQPAVTLHKRMLQRCPELGWPRTECQFQDSSPSLARRRLRTEGSSVREWRLPPPPQAPDRQVQTLILCPCLIGQPQTKAIKHFAPVSYWTRFPTELEAC